MAIVIQNAKQRRLWDESYPCTTGQALEANQGMGIKFTTGISSGEATVEAQTTVGGRIAGILENTDATATSPAKRAWICKIGMVAVRSQGAFNAGTELMVADTYGRLGTASGSGNYVVAISREAATAADQMIAAEVVIPYPHA
jgi:hypothetical protein